ncbi:Zinc finger A20 and AN1 domain-containing stress-associated protein 9 [Hibiscus syriacus]|uniref:Zinc finger A20 and AN1 domain-containing stress-associated protein 9 n=1 Tax=Hibiscus syriacus TaxID=106335 RepID=A0A6A3C652_HIBSY|nr:Zinc finger A20 and AN1 domain-containing stress-associated protein 9 [Hibiscus syriacus]
MGSEQNQGTGLAPSEPKLCANGCGFFGTAANMNLCSKCYRDLRAGEEQAAKAKAAMEKSLGVQAKVEVVVEAIKPHEELPSEGSSASVVEQQPAVVWVFHLQKEGGVDWVQVPLREYILRRASVPGKT